MRRLVAIAVATVLVLVQPSSVVQVLAQTFEAGAASEGIGVVRAAAAPGAIAASAGIALAPISGPAFKSTLAAPSVFTPRAPAGPTAAVSAAAADPTTVPVLAAAAAPNDAAAPEAAVAADVAIPTAAAPAADAPKGLRGVLVSVRSRLLPASKPGSDANLSRTFDGSAIAKSGVANPVAAPALPADRIRAYLVRPGQAPVMTTLAELPALAARSGFAVDFNKNGHLRVVLGEGRLEGAALSGADVAGLKAALAAGGLNAADKRTRTDSIPLETAAVKPRVGRLQITARLGVGLGVALLYASHFGLHNVLAPILLAGLVANIDRLLRESIYISGMLKAAFKESKTPRWNEVMGGVMGKIFPAIVNLGIFAAMYRGHPVALALAAVLSLAVETFHGFWVNAWDTFQSKIGRHRGMMYQNLFNFSYGQIISGGFRTITFFSLGNVPPPWSIEYWKAVSAMTFVGTFCGTLGYRGLNSIYDKGRIPRWGRAAIQHLRDFCMMMIGPFFGTGNMFMTWLLFGIMQSVDLAIFAVDRGMQTRPIVYLADERVAASPTFHAIYVDRPSPLKEAADGVKNSVLAKPFIAAYRWIAARLRSRSESR